VEVVDIRAALWSTLLTCRALIARTVADDPGTFTEAYLERPNAEYCAWILDEAKWGGAIELSILSKCASPLEKLSQSTDENLCCWHRMCVSW
jgi:hypothetical protein